MKYFIFLYLLNYKMGEKVVEVDSKGIKIRDGKLDMEIRGGERRGLK